MGSGWGGRQARVVTACPPWQTPALTSQLHIQLVWPLCNIAGNSMLTNLLHTPRQTCSMVEEKRRRLLQAHAELERIGTGAQSSSGSGVWGGLMSNMASAFGGPNNIPRGTIRALETEIDSLTGLARWALYHLHVSFSICCTCAYLHCCRCELCLRCTMTPQKQCLVIH